MCIQMYIHNVMYINKKKLKMTIFISIKKKKKLIKKYKKYINYIKII